MMYLCNCKSGERITIDFLSPYICYDYQIEILELINSIPKIKWGIKDLLTDKDYYGDKWKYSFAIYNSSGEIIGVLISYFRIADEKHILDSLYIHKLSIREDYKNNGIGSKALQFVIQHVFKLMKWLLNITVQTNDCLENSKVLHFYEKNGFIRLYNVFYTDKVDILMLYKRPEELNSINCEQLYCPQQLKYYHPRLCHIVGALPAIMQLPEIYFSSTNYHKKNHVKFILQNYNIHVSFVSQPFPLTEPQIERADPEEELNLVRFPLKFISRFINNTPYVVEDSMLFIEFFNRNNKKWELPGADTKRWWKQLEAEGLLSILGNTKKRKAKFVSQTGAYTQANEYYFGRGELSGSIADSIPSCINSSIGTYPYFFHQVFIPDGATKTLSEMNAFEFSQYDYMRLSFRNLIEQLSMSYSFYNKYAIILEHHEE